MLDEGAFEHEGLEFGSADNVIERTRGFHHFCHLGLVLGPGAKILADPVFENFGLADVNDMP